MVNVLFVNLSVNQEILKVSQIGVLFTIFKVNLSAYEINCLFNYILGDSFNN